MSIPADEPRRARPAVPRFGLAALALAGLLATAGCDPVERAPATAERPAGEAVFVPRDGQVRLGSLRLGLDSVEEAAGGAAGAREGLAARVWLTLAGGASQPRAVELRPGERTELGGYTVFVEQLRGGRQAGAVFRVQEPAKR